MMRRSSNIPIQRICVSVCSEDEHNDESQVAKQEEPAEELGPGENEVDDQDDCEKQRRLPCVEPANLLANEPSTLPLVHHASK